jgi:hypothetical protein
MTPTPRDAPKSNFVGAFFPFFPLCIDEGSFCSMPNQEPGITEESIRQQYCVNDRRRNVGFDTFLPKRIGIPSEEPNENK